MASEQDSVYESELRSYQLLWRPLRESELRSYQLLWRPLGESPADAPLPAHLLRERLVIPAPCACPVYGGRLAKLGENITETLEIAPRQWKVIQTVREKFTCRSCEKITQPRAPFHAIARARAGASLLVIILYAKFGQRQPAPSAK